MISFVLRFILLVSVFVGGFSLYVILWPVDIKVSPWEVSPYPKQEGVLAYNEKLSKAARFGLELPGIGPETIAFDPEGYIYTGLSNGQIIKMKPDGSAYEVYAQTGGWPLGLVIDKEGNLYTANTELGLQKVSLDRKVQNLAPVVAGKPATFTNGLTLSDDNVIYASISSNKVKVGASGIAKIIIDPAGRIIEYDLKSGQAKEFINDIRFANGVVMTHDQSGLIYGESGTGKILVHHLKGQKAGTSETLIPRMPGIPDGFSQGKNGTYWIANFDDGKILDLLAGSPFSSHIFLNLPVWLLESSLISKKNSSVIAMDEKGQIIQYLQDGAGVIPNVTSAVEKDGYLYFGNISSRHIYRLKIE